MSHRRAKLGLFLFLGSVLMAFGVALVGNSDLSGNISFMNSFTTLFMSIIIFFFAGLFWTMVGAALKRD